MQQYFVEFNPLDKQVEIKNDDYHHIKVVMRMKLGDNLALSNGNQIFYAEISEINQESVVCELLYEVKENKELPIDVIIAQGMPKSDKFELVIQKTTELGVKEIIPVLSKRSIIKLDQKKADKKIERYKKIAKEASEQCHRIAIPKINSVMSIKEMINYSKEFKYKLVAYEASDDMYNFKHIIRNIELGEKMIVFIGPEGGITDEEITLLRSHDFKVVSLGPRILRTETAPIYIMSAISYELELKG